MFPWWILLLLAVLVILLFLRTVRGAFVAAVTIPTTIVATYSFLLYMDFTLNMMSMLALTISVADKSSPPYSRTICRNA